MVTVEKRNYLDALPNKSAGEYAVVKEEGIVYQYHIETDSWEPIKLNGEGLQVSLLEINRNIFDQLQPMSDEKLREVHSDVFKFLGETMNPSLKDNYWALMCWDRHYTTIFKTNPESDEELSDIFMEIIESLGDVKDISDNGGGALEIWITDEKGTVCYLFFNYNEGIVEGVA